MKAESLVSELYEPSAEGSDAGLSETTFRKAEKRYKLYRQNHREARRNPHPDCDFSNVVDFRNPMSNTEANRSLIRVVEDVGGTQMQCFTFAAVPGFLVFPGVLSEREQEELCRDAILDYAVSKRHPNHLSTHASNPCETTRYEPNMRWATLGFSYQWTSKTYVRDRYSSFPKKLKNRIEQLTRLVGHVRQDQFGGTEASIFEPQTAIVNFYPVGSMMMAHQDISEESLEQPIISISLGCSCVFLMGSASRKDEPHAFWLRSGDVAVFSGPSRVAFHAIPRIMDDCPPHLCLSEEGHETGDAVEENEMYWKSQMRHMRININVRQVYADSCSYLFEE